MQVFYWTHMLVIPFLVINVLHSPYFWAYVVAPGALYVAEKVYGSPLTRLAKYGRTYITDVTLLPSQVCVGYVITRHV